MRVAAFSDEGADEFRKTFRLFLNTWPLNDVNFPLRIARLRPQARGAGVRMIVAYQGIRDCHYAGRASLELVEGLIMCRWMSLVKRLNAFRIRVAKPVDGLVRVPDNRRRAKSG